jgi:hypothetical protein
LHEGDNLDLFGAGLGCALSVSTISRHIGRHSYPTYSNLLAASSYLVSNSAYSGERVLHNSEPFPQPSTVDNVARLTRIEVGGKS